VNRKFIHFVFIINNK